MSSNPYAPPQAEVEDIRSPASKEGVYFSVSLFKFVVMFVCTFGLYRIYWFYQNWKLIKERDGRDIVPLARAIFQIFFAYSFFKHVRAEAESRNISPLPPAGLLFCLWIPLILTSRLPGLLSLLTFASVFVFLPVQSCANKVNAQAAPDHDPNSRIVGWNWVAVLLGIPTLVLGVIGLTMG